MMKDNTDLKDALQLKEVDTSPPTDVEDILLFKKSLLPILCQIVFWGGSFFCLILGVNLISQGESFFAGNLFVILGIILVVCGPVMLRFVCEVAMLLFHINENIEKQPVVTGTQASNNLTEAITPQNAPEASCPNCGVTFPREMRGKYCDRCGKQIA